MVPPQLGKRRFKSLERKTESISSKRASLACPKHPYKVYRDRDTLRIADQMVQVALDKAKTSTVFLLNSNCLADLVQLDQNALQAEYKTLVPLIAQLML